MFAELINAIEKLSVRASAAEVLTVQGVHGKAWTNVNGAITALDLDAPLRDHRVDSFNDLVAMANDRAIAPNPQLFHGPSEVSLVLDQESRREVITCPLRKTARFSMLEGMVTRPFSGTPSQVIRLIRFDLQGIGADALAASLSRVDFKRLAVDRISTRHGEDSLGRSVEAAVQNTTQIPETFIAELPVYANDGLRGITVQVKCGVFIDSSEGVITLQPLSDEIANAMHAVQRDLSELISSMAKNVPRYWGTVVLKP